MYTHITLLTNLIRIKHLCCCVITIEPYSSCYLLYFTLLYSTCTPPIICVVKDKM